MKLVSKYILIFYIEEGNFKWDFKLSLCYEDCGLLGCGTILCGSSLLMFWMNVAAVAVSFEILVTVYQIIWLCIPG